MNDLWDRIRRRLRPGGTPTMPELYPGQNPSDSVEIAQEAQSTSVGGPDPHDDFLDAGRITLEPSGDQPSGDEPPDGEPHDGTHDSSTPA